MKIRIQQLSVQYALMLFLLSGCAQQDHLPELEGLYFGQTPPGMVPEVFLPGILNTETKGAFCTVFGPMLDEFYFVSYDRGVEGSGGLHQMRSLQGTWSAPEQLPFSEIGQDNDMCLSSDGERMIFRSWRPLPNGTAPSDHSWLWVADRSEGEWNEARPLLVGGEVVRTGYPSLAEDGSLYFAHLRNGAGGIYRARPADGEYSAPEFVVTLFEESFIHGDMFIAPDENYMIVSGRDADGNIGFGLLDLYVLFRQSDVSWSEPINMGNSINTEAGENCPQVSPDGKYFFFNRYDPDSARGNMYWVDVGIIETLRPPTPVARVSTGVGARTWASSSQ